MLHKYYDQVMSEVASAREEIELHVKMASNHNDTEENKAAAVICAELLKYLKDTEDKLNELMEK